MPRQPIDTLPDTARAWVFSARDALTPDAESALLAEVDAFLDEWRAHGTPLVAARELREARFLCVAVDESATGASGCSIDGLFRRLQGLESTLGTSLLGRGDVYWRDADGLIVRSTRAQFAAQVASGGVSPSTHVFDTTLTGLDDWRSAFEQPAAESWASFWLRRARR